MDVRLVTFKEFWLVYLAEHSRRSTRYFHCFGTIVAMSLAAAGVRHGSVLLIILAAIIGYGLAGFSHFAFEKNRPTTWRYPLWSFLADIKLTTLLLSGKIK